MARHHTEVSKIQKTSIHSPGAVSKKPNYQTQLMGISMALGHVIDAAWLDSGSKRALQAFVEQGQEAEDDLKLKQPSQLESGPQAHVSAYENHSKGEGDRGEIGIRVGNGHG